MLCGHSPIVKDTSSPYSFEEPVKTKPSAAKKASPKVMPMTHADADADDADDADDGAKKDAAAKKTSPKERRQAAREQVLLDKVDQHVNEYKTRLVEKLHEKKSDPDSLLKSSTLDPASPKKSGRKEKSGRK